MSIELHKVYTGAGIIVLSLAATFWLGTSRLVEANPMAVSSLVVQPTDEESELLAKMDASKPKPVRLDVTTSVHGVELKKTGLHVLNDKQQDAFVRLVTSSSALDALEIKAPMMGWRRLGVVSSSLVLRRVSPNCIRLEDPEEPTANYYGICLNEGILVVHTVGEVPHFS